MARYVDGFVMCVPKKRLADYRRLALKASKVFLELGALEYKECVGDDVNTECGMPFPKMAKTKSDEVVVFSWVIYKSRSHRDRVSKALMKDPRMKMPEDPPFSMKRMAYGGFKTIVDK